MHGQHADKWFICMAARCWIVTQTITQEAQVSSPNNLINNKKAVLPQGNRAMPQVFFSVEVRQQHSLQV